MANQQHLDILRQKSGLLHSPETWNKWREEHPEIRPDLSDADLTNFNLRGANLSYADCSGTEFSSTNMSEANLIGANLREAGLVVVDLSRANLSNAILCDAELSGSNFSEANLSKANLTGAIFNGPHIFTTKNADLSGVNLSGAILSEVDLSGINFSGANLSNADLRGANLQGSNLSEANLSGADLTESYVYAISAWNVRLENTKQTNLIITRDDEPTITVDNLEVAQFIYMLLKHEKLRDVLNSIIQKGVLLLGRFRDGGIELLQSIATELREMKYLPMIFDFDRPEDRDYTETVKTLVGLSRFVIVDLSGLSVPQELYATVPHFAIPFVTIIEEGRKPHVMFRDLLKYPWVFSPITFSSKEQLIEILPSRVITPVEEKFKERQALLNQLFNR